MKRINATNFEEWFFEYFEGTLRKEEKELVINFIDSDPVYREEFEYWEKTYVREPLPGKLKIENSLLKKEPSNLYYRYSGIALLFLAATLYFIWSISDEPNRITSIDKKNNSSTLPLPEIKSEVSNEKPGTKILKNTKIVSSNNVQQPYTEQTKKSSSLPIVASDTKEEEKVTFQKEERDSITTVASTEIAKDTTTQEVVITTNNNKKLSQEEKKKRRALEKFKQKTLEKKQAEKYLKGKVPYVIPVNPNNFKENYRYIFAQLSSKITTNLPMVDKNMK